MFGVVMRASQLTKRSIRQQLRCQYGNSLGHQGIFQLCCLLFTSNLMLKENHYMLESCWYRKLLSPVPRRRCHYNIYTWRSTLNQVCRFARLPCLPPPSKLMRPTLTQGRLSMLQIIEGKTKHDLQTLSRRRLFLKATIKWGTNWSGKSIMWLRMRRPW